LARRGRTDFVFGQCRQEAGRRPALLVGLLRDRRPHLPDRRQASGFLDGDTAQHLIAHYGYAAIFLVVMMESTGIPMPGETILISAALAGTKHALDIRGVIAAAAGGAIVGDNIGLWVGREFGEPLLEKWGYLVGLDARKRLLGRYLFARYGGQSSHPKDPAERGDEAERKRSDHTPNILRRAFVDAR
jgi:hypothetical protein